MSTVTAPAFSFNGENKSAQKVAARQAAAMVTGISDATRDGLRALVTRSIREGIPVYDAARMIESMVGMDSRQAMAAMNYRADLIESGLTLDRVNTLTDRYVDKKIGERGETIARTEIMDALNQGSLEGYAQAQDEGLLGKDAKKEWITTPVDACDICAPLDGRQVLLGETFDTENGPVDSPPLHPRCRCALSVVP